MSKTFLLLKATVTKQITVPQYTRADGTIVPAHTKTVHYDPDKSMHDVIHGNGTSSQKQAHKKLSSNPEKWNKLSDEDKHAHILSSATNIQVKKTFNGNVAKFKKAILEGKVPQAGHYNAVMSDEMGADKREKLLNELKSKVGEEQVNSLMQQAGKKAEGKQSGQKVAQAKHNTHAHKKAESYQKVQAEHKAKQAQQKQSKISSALKEHIENNNFKDGFKALLNVFLEQNDFENKSDEEKIKLLEKFTATTAHKSPNQSLHLQDFVDSLKKKDSEEKEDLPKQDKEETPKQEKKEKFSTPKNFPESIFNDMKAGKYGDGVNTDAMNENPSIPHIVSYILSQEKDNKWKIFELSQYAGIPNAKKLLSDYSHWFIKDQEQQEKEALEDEKKVEAIKQAEKPEQKNVDSNSSVDTFKTPNPEIKEKSPSAQDFEQIEKYMMAYAQHTHINYSKGAIGQATNAEYKANDIAVASVEGSLFKQICMLAFDDAHAHFNEEDEKGKNKKVFDSEKLGAEHKKAYDTLQKIKNGNNVYEAYAELEGVDVATAMIRAKHIHESEVNAFAIKMKRRLVNSVGKIFHAGKAYRSSKNGDLLIGDIPLVYLADAENAKSLKENKIASTWDKKTAIGWRYNLTKGQVEVYKNSAGIPQNVIDEQKAVVEKFIQDKLVNGGMAEAVQSSGFHYAQKNVPMQASQMPKNGPQEGDTKVVDGHTYVLKNGRWHLVSKDEPEQKEAVSDEQDKTEHQQFIDSLSDDIKAKLDNHGYGLIDKEAIKEISQEDLKTVKDILTGKTSFSYPQKVKKLEEILGADTASTSAFLSNVTDHFSSQQEKEAVSDEQDKTEHQQFIDSLSDDIKAKLDNHGYGLIDKEAIKEISQEDLKTVKDILTGKTSFSYPQKVKKLEEILGADTASTSAFLSNVTDHFSSQQEKEQEKPKAEEKPAKEKGIGAQMLDDFLESFSKMNGYKDISEKIIALKNSEEFQKKSLSEKFDDVYELFSGHKNENHAMAYLNELPIKEPPTGPAKDLTDIELKIKGGLYGQDAQEALAQLWNDKDYEVVLDERKLLNFYEKIFDEENLDMPEELKNDLDAVVGAKAVSKDLFNLNDFVKAGYFGTITKNVCKQVENQIDNIIKNESFTKAQKLAFFNKLADQLADPIFKNFVAEIENGGHPFYDADAGKMLLPKEGDTKVVNGVTYVLKNGHWHKVDNGIEADKKTANKEWIQPNPGQSVEDACYQTMSSHVENSNASPLFKKYIKNAIDTVEKYSWANPLWKARMIGLATKDYLEKYVTSDKDKDVIFDMSLIYKEAVEKAGLKGMFDLAYDEDDKIKNLKEILKYHMSSDAKDIMGQILIYNHAQEINSILKGDKTPHQKVMAVKKIVKGEPTTSTGDLFDKIDALSKKSATANKKQLSDEEKWSLLAEIIDKAKKGEYGDHVKNVLGYPSSKTVLDGTDGEDIHTQVAMIKNLMTLKDAKEFVNALKKVSDFKIDKNDKSHLNPNSLEELLTKLKQGYFGKNNYSNVTFAGHPDYYKDKSEETINKIGKLATHANFYATGNGGSDLSLAVSNLKKNHFKKMSQEVFKEGIPMSIKDIISSSPILNNAVKNTKDGEKILIDILKDYEGQPSVTSVKIATELIKDTSNIASLLSAIKDIDKEISSLFGFGETFEAKYVKQQKAKTEEKQGNNQKKDGPHEGDTKQGKTGLLQLVDGHWVLVDKYEGFKNLYQSVMDGEYGISTPDLFEHVAKIKGFSLDSDPEMIAKEVFDYIKPKLGGSIYSKLSEALSEFSVEVQDEFQKFKDDAKAKKDYAQQQSSQYKNIQSQNDGIKELHISELTKPDIPETSSWKQVGGQAGSNEGGLFEDEDGQKWYCKFPKDPEHAKSEVLAGQLYKACGIPVAETQIISRNGKIGIASKYIDGLKSDKNSVGSMKGAKDGFAVDAWLGNWDAVGMSFDNLLSDGNGSAVRIDVGGSLEYRAQGAKKGKDFGNKVTEIDTLLDSSKNAQTSHVFGGMSKEEIAESVKNVLKLTDDSIRNIVQSYGPDDKKEQEKLIKKLINRKNDLKEKFPEVAKEFEPKLEIQIPEPPDFNNYYGTGPLSQKKWKNDANNDVAKKVYEAVKDGGSEALNGITFDSMDEAGNVIKKGIPISEHPSLKLQSYIKEAKISAENPVEVPPEGLVHVHEKAKGGFWEKLMDSFKKVKFIKEAVKEIGRYAVLGRIIGGNLGESLVFPSYKKSEQKELLKQMAIQSNKNWESLTEGERKAIKSYTGDGYWSLNPNIVSGNLQAKEKALLKGVEKASVEIPEGFMLSRRLKIKSPEEFKALVESEGMILQDFNGAISTAFDPHVWSGNIQLRITVAKGVKGLMVSGGQVGEKTISSVGASESEILLNHGTRFYVKKVHEEGHQIKDEYGMWGGDYVEGGNSDKRIIEVIAIPG